MIYYTKPVKKTTIFLLEASVNLPCSLGHLQSNKAHPHHSNKQMLSCIVESLK